MLTCCVPACARAQEYVSLAFSADGKMLLAQGGAPEWNLVLWVWEKSKVAATLKTTNQQGLPVTSVSDQVPTFQPSATTQHCSFGKLSHLAVSFSLLQVPAEARRVPLGPALVFLEYKYTQPASCVCVLAPCSAHRLQVTVV